MPISLRPSHRLAALLLLASAIPVSAAESLQAVAERAVQSTEKTFSARGVRPEQLAVTVLDLGNPSQPARGSVRGDVPIYPASVIKLFYLAAAHRWMEDGKLVDTPELRRAMRDMIVDSSNDATHYVIDLLTGTTSGPELLDSELKIWFERRNAVTNYFASLGYTGVLAHKKPWGDGPYGREAQAIRLFEPKRNMLTTDATARLLAEIVTGKCVTPARSAEMRALLARNQNTPSDDPDDQATAFIAAALPPGTKLWSKAGWTSQARHDAAYVELPYGRKLVLVIFTEKNSKQKDLIPTVARALLRR